MFACGFICYYCLTLSLDSGPTLAWLGLALQFSLVPCMWLCTILVHRFFLPVFLLFPCIFLSHSFFFCSWRFFFIHFYLFSLCCCSHFFLRLCYLNHIAMAKKHVTKLQLELRFRCTALLTMMGYHTLGLERLVSLPNR